MKMLEDIKSWNGEINFEKLFYINVYEDFYKMIVSLLKYINSLPSYYIDFEERVEEDENNSTSK